MDQTRGGGDHRGGRRRERGEHRPHDPRVEERVGEEVTRARREGGAARRRRHPRDASKKNNNKIFRSHC